MLVAALARVGGARARVGGGHLIGARVSGVKSVSKLTCKIFGDITFY